MIESFVYPKFSVTIGGREKSLKFWSPEAVAVP